MAGIESTLAREKPVRMAPLVRQPILRSGDNLTRAEFLAIWESLPEIKRAELIGGIVYMPSPVSKDHSGMEFRMTNWLGHYQIATPGCDGDSNATTLMLDDSPQPDIQLRLLPGYGGNHLEGPYLVGAPEFIVEICYSSAAYDLHQKLDLYQKAGVQEYLTILLQAEETRWHALTAGKYELLLPDADGVQRSRVFPGLWLDGQALLDNNMPQVFARLQEGITSAEHQRFVAELAARKERATS